MMTNTEILFVRACKSKGLERVRSVYRHFYISKGITRDVATSNLIIIGV